jgi:hypothetical protein
MRALLLAGLLMLGSAPAGFAARPAASISSAGATLGVPLGWHAVVARTPNCDPERLLVVSSAPIRPGARRVLAAPVDGQVLILLLEDRYRVDRPVGDLRRPVHFSVAWDHLTGLKGACDAPSGPAFMRYFRAHGRYIGFIVYPGAHLGPATRARTLQVMDSLRVSS